MGKVKKILTLSLTLLSLSSIGLEDHFCEDKLNEELNKFFKENDHRFLSNLFELASLKLGAFIEGNGSGNSILQEPDDYSFENTKADLQKLYNKYHPEPMKLEDIEANYQKALEIQTEEKRRLAISPYISNEDMAHLFSAIKSRQSNCGEVCIKESDVATVWLMGLIQKRLHVEDGDDEGARKYYLSIHRSALGRHDVGAKATPLENKLNEDLKDFIDKFLEQYEDCRSYVEENYSCLNTSGLEILKTKALESVILSDKFQAESNIPISLEYKKISFDDESKMKLSYQRDMCGGKPYHQEVRNRQVYGADPVEFLLKNTNNKGLFKDFCRFQVGVFGVRCTPYTKVFKWNSISAETNVCCQEKESWSKFHYKSVSLIGGVELKGYYGLGGIAEIGFLVGANISLIYGDGTPPRGCSKSYCSTKSAVVNTYGGGYLDILSTSSKKSLVGVEGKVVWKPNVSIKTCSRSVDERIITSADKNDNTVTWSPGGIYLQGTLHLGWVITYDFYKKIYESSSVDTFNLSVF